MTDDSAARDGGGGTGAQAAVQGAVLRRLLRGRNTRRADAGEAPGMPQNLPQTPARGAATALCRAADNLYGMPVRALSVVPGALTLPELPEMMPERPLLAVVAGPGDALGVVAMDPQVVTGLIEVQALGRVTARAPEHRKPTRSDALMCADFVNRLLAELQAEISGLEGYENYSGFTYVSHLDDVRPLMLMLEDTGFRTLKMSLALGAEPSRREGRIFVALPQVRAVAALPAPAPRPINARIAMELPAQRDRGAGAPAPVAPPPAGPSLAAAMQGAPVELLAILCRRKVSLGELRGLRPGKLLPLPRVSLYDARIETRQGQVLAFGKLGEADGCHAIRLHDPAQIGDARPAPGYRSELPAAAPRALSAAPLAAPRDEPLAAMPFDPVPQGFDPGADLFAAEPVAIDLGEPDQFRIDPLPMPGLAAG